MPSYELCRVVVGSLCGGGDREEVLGIIRALRDATGCRGAGSGRGCCWVTWCPLLASHACHRLGAAPLEAPDRVERLDLQRHRAPSARPSGAHSSAGVSRNAGSISPTAARTRSSRSRTPWRPLTARSVSSPHAPLPVDACSSSQLVASRVAPLLAEQKSANRAGTVLRFVRGGSARRLDLPASLQDSTRAALRCRFRDIGRAERPASARQSPPRSAGYGRLNGALPRRCGLARVSHGGRAGPDHRARSGPQGSGAPLTSFGALFRGARFERARREVQERLARGLAG